MFDFKLVFGSCEIKSFLLLRNFPYYLVQLHDGIRTLILRSSLLWSGIVVQAFILGIWEAETEGSLCVGGQLGL